MTKFLVFVQYLVNAPEGFARLALEHRVRPDGSLRAVLATGLSSHALVSGLHQLWLRLSK